MNASKRCSRAALARTYAACVSKNVPTPAAAEEDDEGSERPNMSGPKRVDRCVGVRPDVCECEARRERRSRVVWRSVERWGGRPWKNDSIPRAG